MVYRSKVQSKITTKNVCGIDCWFKILVGLIIKLSVIKSLAWTSQSDKSLTTMIVCQRTHLFNAFAISIQSREERERENDTEKRVSKSENDTEKGRGERERERERQEKK